MSEAQIAFARELFDRLWDTYQRRVPYASVYRGIVESAGGSFVNDHVALRTFRIPSEGLGLEPLAEVFIALGYSRQEREPLLFPDQHLTAFSYRHESGALPKVFISQLEVEKLQSPARKVIEEFARGWRGGLSGAELDGLRRIDAVLPGERARLLAQVARLFTERPWRSLPVEQDVREISEQSQYAAWVMLFGHNVNHFTGYVNAIKSKELADIERVAEAMAQRGVPMKREIEGERGTKLRQTSSHAARSAVRVLDEQGQEKAIEWPYAYFEIAQRAMDPATGRLFEGFLGPQATKLFDMTKTGQQL